jgi:hypothetical protein
MRVLLALLVLPTLAVPAAATATLSCDIDRGGVIVHVMGSVGADHALSGLRGELTPPDGKTLDFADGRVTAHRIGRNAIRLRLRWDHPPTGLDLSLRRVADDDFAGRFRLERFFAGGTTNAGPARCQLGY